PDGDAGRPLAGFPLVGLLAAASMIASVILAGRLRRAPAAPQGPHAREALAEAAEGAAFWRRAPAPGSLAHPRTGPRRAPLLPSTGERSCRAGDTSGWLWPRAWPWRAAAGRRRTTSTGSSSSPRG